MSGTGGVQLDQSGQSFFQNFFGSLMGQVTAPILQPGDTPLAGETPSILGSGSPLGTIGGGGSSPASGTSAQPSGTFDSGWLQLLACIMMMIIGTVIFVGSLKQVPVVNQVVSTTSTVVKKGAGKAAKATIV